MATRYNPFTRKLDIIVGGDIKIQAADVSDFSLEVDARITASPLTGTHTQGTDTALRVDRLVVDVNGNTDIVGELSIKVYAQALEPILTANTRIAMWENTNNGNVFMIYKDSSGNNKLVELG